MLTKEEHKKIHQELHIALDKLVADYIVHTGRGLRNSTIMDLMQWSAKQTDNPTIKD